MTFIKWILKIFILAFVFLILLYSAGECRECGSISVKINLTAFTDLAECTVIRGNLMVALLERHSSVFEQFVFPKLKYVFFINRFFLLLYSVRYFSYRGEQAWKPHFEYNGLLLVQFLNLSFPKNLKTNAVSRYKKCLRSVHYN